MFFARFVFFKVPFGSRFFFALNNFGSNFHRNKSPQTKNSGYVPVKEKDQEPDRVNKLDAIDQPLWTALGK